MFVFHNFLNCKIIHNRRSTMWLGTIAKLSLLSRSFTIKLARDTVVYRFINMYILRWKNVYSSVISYQSCLYNQFIPLLLTSSTFSCPLIFFLFQAWPFVFQRNKQIKLHPLKNATQMKHFNGQSIHLGFVYKIHFLHPTGKAHKAYSLCQFLDSILEFISLITIAFTYSMVFFSGLHYRFTFCITSLFFVPLPEQVIY